MTTLAEVCHEYGNGDGAAVATMDAGTGEAGVYDVGAKRDDDGRVCEGAGLILAAGVAGSLRLAGVPPEWATGLGLAFGLAGVAVMLLWSRRTGQMTHCLTWCPVGVLATWLGRLSPWRMRIAPGCDDCASCSPACRYDALRFDHIRARRPGPSCTLCGDCVRVCKRRFIEYRLSGLSPRTARLAFLVVVVSLHAVFLGVARI